MVWYIKIVSIPEWICREFPRCIWRPQDDINTNKMADALSRMIVKPGGCATFYVSVPGAMSSYSAATDATDVRLVSTMRLRDTRSSNGREKFGN